jgi:hypothetical protein
MPVAGQIRSFCKIACATRDAKIIEAVCAAMLLGDDVINVRREPIVVGLMDSAILATASGASPNQSTCGRVHLGLSVFASSSLAFALSVEMNVP